MNPMQRLKLISRNTKEILTFNELKKLVEGRKKISAYNGTAPTGPYHMAYLVPLGKMFDLSKAGVETKILIADIHAALDDLKTPWEEIELRSNYYEKCIELSFPWQKKPKFVRGNSIQMNDDYMLDVLKVSTISTVKRAKRAASEVCRLKNPKVSELLYPIFQALDEEYLKVDIQVGGIDQRHIMAFAREILPKVGYKQRVELMTPLVASLKGPGTKMSATDPSSHIKVYDSEQAIENKLKKAYCPEGSVEENPVTQLCKFIIFPINEKLKVERPKKFGGDVTYNSYVELEKEFIEKKLHPMDLKLAVAKELSKVFKKARAYFEKHSGFLKELGKEFEV